MGKAYTLYLFNPSGTRVIHKRLPMKIAACAACAVLLSIIALGFAISDYLELKTFKERYQAQRRAYTIQRAEVAEMSARIENRDKQLKALFQKLDILQAQLSDLAEFERKIRNIAGTDEIAGHYGVYGVGGEVEAARPASIYEDPLRYLNGRVEALNQTAAKRSQSLEDLFNVLRSQQELLAVTPSIRPVKGGWISSSFGYRDSPFSEGKEFHSGVDIANRLGAPVKATADGVVTFAGKKGLLGKAVVIDHGYGIVTRYGHLAKWLVSAGDTVKKGQVIGEVGNTGRSTGPHLHYEVRFNNTPMDAQKYMSQYLAKNTTQ